MKFQTQFNPDYKGSPGSEQSNESETDPSQVISLRQMLINHARGIHTNVKQYEDAYFGEDTPPPFEDMVDAREFAEDLREKQKETEAKLADLKAQKQKQDAEIKKREFEQQRAAFQARQRKSETPSEPSKETQVRGEQNDV
jgi:hypothetical protein